MSGRTPSDCKACRTGGPHDDLPWARGDDRTDRRRGVARRNPVGTAPRHRLPALEQRDRGDGRARARPRRRLGCVRKAGGLLPRAGAPRRLSALPEHTTTAPPCRSPSAPGPPTPDRWRSDAVRADADTPSTAWTRPRRGTCTVTRTHPDCAAGDGAHPSSRSHSPLSTSLWSAPSAARKIAARKTTTAGGCPGTTPFLDSRPPLGGLLSPTKTE
jgi:hypothetical protein